MKRGWENLSKDVKTAVFKFFEVTLLSTPQ
jgi:hypothetical protein